VICFCGGRISPSNTRRWRNQAAKPEASHHQQQHELKQSDENADREADQPHGHAKAEQR
jgi:hypothetical protein